MTHIDPGFPPEIVPPDLPGPDIAPDYTPSETPADLPSPDIDPGDVPADMPPLETPGPEIPETSQTR